jgi:hypothetical protein
MFRRNQTSVASRLQRAAGMGIVLAMLWPLAGLAALAGCGQKGPLTLPAPAAKASAPTR